MVPQSPIGVNNTESNLTHVQSTDAQRAAWLLDEAHVLTTLLSDVLRVDADPRRLDVLQGRVAWWGKVRGVPGHWVADRSEPGAPATLHPFLPCPRSGRWVLGHVVRSRDDAEVWQAPRRMPPHWCDGGVCDGAPWVVVEPNEWFEWAAGAERAAMVADWDGIPPGVGP
jgi:hypothetical protein